MASMRNSSKFRLPATGDDSPGSGPRFMSAAFAVMFAALVAGQNSRITHDELLALVNGARERSGVSPLKKDPRLGRAAQARADDMARRGYFAHNSPGGKTPWDFIKETGYRYEAAGENLATGQRTAEEVQRSWQRSSGHRANQLNRRFTETGIGIAKTRSGVVVVQIFASPLLRREGVDDAAVNDGNVLLVVEHVGHGRGVQIFGEGVAP